MRGGRGRGGNLLRRRVHGIPSDGNRLGRRVYGEARKGRGGDAGGKKGGRVKGIRKRGGEEGTEKDCWWTRVR